MTGGDGRAAEFGAPPEEGAGPHKGRPALIVAVGFLLLVVLAAVFLIVATREHGKVGGDHQAAPSQPSPTSSPSGGLDETDQAIPTGPPAGVSWQIFQGVAVPNSQAAGPSRIRGPVFAGYAHTPTGALLAAVQVSTRSILTPGGGWRMVAEQQLVPGAGRDHFISAEASGGTAPLPSVGGQPGQIAGFKFVHYASSAAVIQLVTRFSDATLQVTTVTVEWANNDWKLAVQPDGGLSPNAQAIPNLSGFVPWSGVS